MADDLGVWAAGDGYGPVLPQQMLYQLRATLRIHPVLEGKRKDFHLAFDIRTGEAGALNNNSNVRSAQELGPLRDAPATHPRVEQLYLITNKSPWYTLVENKKGVTVGDVISQITVDYRKYVTEWEWTQLSAFVQERMRRAAITAEQEEHDAYYTAGRPAPPAPPAGAIIPSEGRAYRRFLWLKENTWLEVLTHDDKLVEHRFGFKAPDCLVMVMSG
ncbi:hypothetical protein EXIGLDRAFT_676680 [Exidia glandulosa HHB12029]|uniref:DUF6699 domain-containing protein n=1 Tax=Exidia glandulosa HHB12029 TaxID=1314781 RepID=A0A165GNM1_EXIGL|nr:hypothetical protein EXIGLDRAFT_654625 [Exidia glandulosa HHB12029]KZV90781.1 hypothetical protein EXIGLDRAFT_676680 [Exidia glandulosa HHB12029]